MDPATIAALFSTVLNTIGGVMSANGQEVPEGPEDWEKFLGLEMGALNWLSQGQAQDQYEAAADQQYADAMAVSSQIGPEGLAAYDYSSQKGLDELGLIWERSMRQAEQLRQDTMRNRNEFLTGFDGKGNALMAGWDDALAGYRGDLAGFLDEFAAREDSILGGYDDRYNKASLELEGYGDQMKADIDRYYEQAAGAATQDLISRGMLSSLAGQGDLLGVTERQVDAQARLAEDLTRNRINVLSGLSGEKLAAQERLGSEWAGYSYGGLTNLFGGEQNALMQQGALDSAYAAYDAAMRGDELAAQQYMMETDMALRGNMANWHAMDATNRSNIIMGGMGDVLGAIMGFENVPPPPNNLSFDFGYNLGGSPQSSGIGAGFWANAGQGLGQGLYSAFNQPNTITPNQNGGGASPSYEVPFYLAAPEPDWYPITMD